MVRPSPLRTDGSNEFARFSMQVRVPRIVRDVVDRNPDYAPPLKSALEGLASSIEGNALLPAPRPPAPDVSAWTTASAEHRGATWLGAQWFHAELAVYRELTACVRFWETDRDPFAPAKEEELATPRLWTRLGEALAMGGSREGRLASLLDACLWENRVDLSYSVASGREQQDEDLLIDDRAVVASRLRRGGRVEILADNTGTELALDLALVDAILEDAQTSVSLHLKAQPVFVSDALPRDVWRLIDLMGRHEDETKKLATRLCAAFEAGRFRLVPDPFWSGPRFLWEAPHHITSTLASAQVVLIKGDANYRRLVGDCVWPDQASFAHAASYLGTAVACARTLKSDAIVGLPRGLTAGLDSQDPRWRINGCRGLLQSYGM